MLFLFISLQNKVPTAVLTRDSNAVAELPFYVGAVSNIGVIFWSATASICLFVFFSTDNSVVYKRLRSYVLFSGLLTLMFLLDDLFQLHEEFFPDYLFIPKLVA